MTIARFPESTPLYKIDIGRPSFFSDDDCLLWQKFFTFVEESEIQIAVNGIYDTMRNYAFQMKRYGGGGYAFTFWFDNKKSRRLFAKEVETIFGQHVRDSRNVMVVIKRDEDTGKYVPEGLRFDPKYFSRAEEVSSGLGITIEKYFTPSCYSGQFLIEPKETGLYIAKGDCQDVLKLRAVLDDYFFELDE